MNRTHRWPWIVAALLVAACGPGSKAQPTTELNDDQQPDPGCSGTFSGAAMGTFDCYLTTTTSAGAGTVGVEIEYVHLVGAVDAFPADVTWPGSALEPTTITEATPSVHLYSSITVEDSAPSFYATRGQGGPAGGSFSLVISRVAAGVPHGTFSGQLCKLKGCDAGNLSLAITF